MRRGLAALFAAATLAGCTVGPAYRPPAPGPELKPATFAAAEAAVSREAPPDAWWRLYADPALDALVSEALAANTDLRAAPANLAVARAALDEARAGRQPQTPQAASVGYGVSLPSLILQDAARVDPQPSWTLQPTLDVSWELDLYGRLHRGVQAARADAEGAQAALEGVRVTVAAVQRRSIAIAARSAEVTRAPGARRAPPPPWRPPAPRAWRRRRAPPCLRSRRSAATPCSASPS